MKITKRLILFIWQIEIALTTRMGLSGGKMCHPGDDFVESTFTCLERQRGSRQSWPDAAEQCRQRKGGQYKKTAGYLPRADRPDILNTLHVIITKTHGLPLWIGLHYTTKGYRWQNFPDDQPARYLFPRGYRPLNDITTPYVQQGADFKWNDTDADKLNGFVCEYEALSLGIELSCPPLYIMENLTTSFTISSKIIYQHSHKIEWYVPGKTKPVAICQLYSFCSTFKNGKWNYSSDISKRESTLTYYSVGLRPPSGKWWCKMTKGADYLGPSRIDNETCNVYFYYPPKDMNCNYEHLPNQINVTCITEKVFPQASCDWTIMIKTWPSSFSFQSNNQYQLETYNHESYLEGNGNLYYRTNCSVLFDLDPNSDLIFIAVFVAVKLYPGLATLSTLPTAFITDTISIELAKRSKSKMGRSKYNDSKGSKESDKFNGTDTFDMMRLNQEKNKLDNEQHLILYIIEAIVSAMLILSCFILYTIVVVFRKRTKDENHTEEYADEDGERQPE